MEKLEKQYVDTPSYLELCLKDDYFAKTYSQFIGNALQVFY